MPPVRALTFGAAASLATLFAINLANYIDRYLVIAMSERIQHEFKLEDHEVGLLTTSFIFVYMFASPFCGALADRVARKWIVASAVALWSLATAFASFAPTFRILLGARATVGIGEAGYNAAGQALLADIFPAERRNRALATLDRKSVV